jgi:hypothetical protein
MSPNAGNGERGCAGSQLMSTAVDMHGAQINFGDLTPYLTLMYTILLLNHYHVGNSAAIKNSQRYVNKRLSLN